jgi:HAD superfamily hydrolase (TIGR01549 family)
MIRWIFFDVGNVLFSDDPVMTLVYQRLWEAIDKAQPGFSFDQLMAERERRIRTNSYGHYSLLALRYLDPETWETVHRAIQAEVMETPIKYYFPVPGARPVLETLAGRYRLAIAANQPPSCRTMLQHFKLLSFFDLVGLSDEMGLAKPDPRFFQSLLEQAGATAEETLMVGDRTDYDIGPAKRLGMKTIRLILSVAAKGNPPDSIFGRKYVESIERAAISTADPRGSEEEPDLMLYSWAEISSAVDRLAQV